VFSPGPHVLRSECQAFGCGVAVSAATMLDLNVREAEHLAASEGPAAGGARAAATSTSCGFTGCSEQVSRRYDWRR
jgi:hypothetical protein